MTAKTKKVAKDPAREYIERVVRSAVKYADRTRDDERRGPWIGKVLREAGPPPAHSLDFHDLWK